MIDNEVNGELAILHVRGPFGIVDACALYNPHFGSIPQKLENTPKLLGHTPHRIDGCSDYKDVTRFWNATSFVYAGNCTNYEKLRKAQQAGAKQVIIISKSGNDYPSGTKDQFNYIHIPAGMILETSWNTVQGLGEPLVVQFWHPHDPLFDPNLVIIWILACFCVAVGSFWSGVTTQNRLAKEGDSLAEHQDDDTLEITPVSIVIFIGVICTILLLLYFFYKYLIYVVIGLFSIAACNGTFDCLRAAFSYFTSCSCSTPTLPIIKSKVEYRSIILLFVSAGLVIWWVVERHSSYAWIIQDFLGVCFCVSLIKLIKLPNLKISAILLVALLVYDIFFVFITPLFSARGKSVMVEVATGKGSKEQLPMVIRVPKLIHTALSLCERPYSLLGFGDILLPGLFVGFCRNYDIVAEVPRSIYFVTSLLGYGVGIIITFVALLLMKSGQPALLYLVPSVLIPVSIVALIKGQFRSLWDGKVKSGPVDNEESANPKKPVNKDIELSQENTRNERRPLLPVQK